MPWESFRKKPVFGYPAPSTRLLWRPPFSFTLSFAPPNIPPQSTTFYYLLFFYVLLRKVGREGVFYLFPFSPCQKPAGITIQSRSKTDSEHMCLFSKIYILGEMLGLSLVPHFSLQKHLHLANIVGHFHITFHFYYFFKPVIISDLLLVFQEDRYFLGNLLFLLSFCKFSCITEKV